MIRNIYSLLFVVHPGVLIRRVFAEMERLVLYAVAVNARNHELGIIAELPSIQEVASQVVTHEAVLAAILRYSEEKPRLRRGGGN